MSEKPEKDILMWAYPERNKAHLEGNSADGFIFVGSASEFKVISGDEVNSTMRELEEKGLTYSFKLGD